jgi:predicted HTH domain antitoxin
MRSSIGEVGDSPNVTKKGDAYYYDGLQATFIDTPGFQQASAVAMYLDAKQEDPKFKMPKNWEAKVRFDLDAMEALEKSHVVIYVGSLSVVPDDSYKEEISIVRRIQPRVLAVLNQARRQLEAGSEEEVDNRIAQWNEVLKEQEIESVIVFDAHWDKPAKINEIYDSVRHVLAPKYRNLFEDGLSQFKERQAELRREACTMLASCIRRCQKQAGVTVKKGQYLEAETRKKIAEELYDANLVFLIRAAKLYQIAAEHPTESKDQLKLRLKESVDFGARIKTGTLVSSVIGGGGAAIGAAIGAVLAGAISGGLGAGAGAALGAQIGGGIGALFGGMGIFLDEDDNVEVGVESEELRDIVAANLAAVWGLSNVGFGRGRELAQGEIETIKNEILSSEILPSDINWITVDEPVVIDYCEKVLKALEELE